MDYRKWDKNKIKEINSLNNCLIEKGAIVFFWSVTYFSFVLIVTWQEIFS